jgi:Tol biopolymer transport system component
MNTKYRRAPHKASFLRSRRSVAGTLLAASGLLAFLSTGATTFERQTNAWDTGRAAGGRQIAISSNGRFVVFSSPSARIVSGDTNGLVDIFLRDRETGKTTRVSVSSSGAQANGPSYEPMGSVTPDGRYVTFHSDATNLVAGDTNGVSEVFLRDMVAGTTERIGVSTSGVQGNGASAWSALSDDGRFVLFDTSASNLIAGESRAATVYLRDRLNSTTRVAGLYDRTAHCAMGALTPDGKMAAFACGTDIYVRNFDDGSVEKVSTYPHAGATDVTDLSADGRFVAFSTNAKVVTADTNDWHDVYLYDRSTKLFDLISVSKSGVSGGNVSLEATVSDDGRYVGFGSWARDLVDNPQGNAFDGFLRDRVTKRTTRVTAGNDGTGCCTYWGLHISADGRTGLLTSDYRFASNDANSLEDVFVATNFVPASFTFRPRSLTFGTVAVGSTSAAQTVTVTNNGTSGLAIAWFSLGGDDPTQFARVRNCPKVLPAGEQCTVTVMFAPTATGGHQARLVVSAGGTWKSTALSGTGE